MSKILLIEDSEFMIRLYEKVFTLENFTVVVASNGMDGIKKAKEEKPDLILLDMMMPQMNGVTTLKYLKEAEETKNIPVVMLTNITGDQDAEKALEQGAVKYIVKSDYEPKDVVKMVREILKN